MARPSRPRSDLFEVSGIDGRREGEMISLRLDLPLYSGLLHSTVT